MIKQEWRLDMRLKDRQMLLQYMDYKRMKIRELAAAAKVSRAVVGHLHSGARKTVRPATARALEEALGAPPGLLFEPVASRVSREVSAA
jgi:transcriptional regulator with XRE-family HTH domain